MDPVWNFPHEELASLFQAATLTESMFVALEHMQVNFVTASKRTRLNKFRKNVISFAQDTPAFAQRVGLMCRYEPGDRVNTRRGPGGSPGTVGKHAVCATEEEKRLSGPWISPASFAWTTTTTSARARSRSLTCSLASGCLGIRST